MPICFSDKQRHISMTGDSGKRVSENGPLVQSASWELGVLPEQE